MQSESAREERPGRRRPFFGWWIVAGGFLLMATCYTVFVNCIPLFQPRIVEDLGIRVGQFNTGVSLCTVVAVFASLAIGRLIDLTDVRILGTFTVLVAFATLLGFSAATQLWHLYALCILAGMVVVAGTRLLASVVIANWFTLKRGLAVSIALSGSGVGGVVLSPVTTMLIEQTGWRAAFATLAFVCLALGLPSCWHASAINRATRGWNPTEPVRWRRPRSTALPMHPYASRSDGRPCVAAARSGSWSSAS